MSRYKLVDTISQLPPSGITAGTFTNPIITFNDKGIAVFAENGPSGAQQLNDLNDVAIVGVINNQILSYNGTSWTNITLDLNNVNDVTINSPATGDFLMWDGAKWVNENPGFVPSSDVGSHVQPFSYELTGLSALNSIGYVTRINNSPTYAIRKLVAGDGIKIVNDNGASGNSTISVDIVDLSYTSIDSNEDLLMFWNTDISKLQATTVSTIVRDATPMLGILTVGVGADIFKQIDTNKNIILRSINSASSGLVLSQATDQITLTLNNNLNVIAGLTPNLNYFMVGTGSNWVDMPPATARIALGLGTMATENANSFLRLTGGTMTGDIDMSTAHTIVNLIDPIHSQDAATKAYVDSLASHIFDEGDGLIKVGNIVAVGQNPDNSIIVNPNDVQLNTSFTDARYYTHTQLNSTTPSSEGAALIGTSTKLNLNNATNVEQALEYLNNNLPIMKNKFSMQATGIWNLDIGAPNVIADEVHDVEVARFVTANDVAIYLDLMLPPDFDNTMDLNLYMTLAKETVAAGSYRVALAYQIFRNPGYTANDIKDINPGTTTAAQVVHWVIPAGTMLPLDTITLRFSRLGTNPADNYPDGLNFLTSYLTQ